MAFVLGVPSSSGATSRVIQQLSKSVIGENNHVLPIGKEALGLLGGKTQEVASKKDHGGFPEDKICIPVGITPQNLSKFTLYDVLGFSGEWGASADVEGERLCSDLYNYNILNLMFFSL